MLDMGPAEATEAMLLWKSPRGVAADPRLLLVGDSMLLLSPPSKAEEAAAAAAVGEAMTTGQAERKPAERMAGEGGAHVLVEHARMSAWHLVCDPCASP